MDEEAYISRYHQHCPTDEQCSSSVVKHINAPIDIVWPLVRSFDQPQKYKPLIKQCKVEGGGGDLKIGSIRQVNVRTGLPATTSTERLEQLDDVQHILRFKIVGGDHSLKNYSSTITVHPETNDSRQGTLVIESFILNVHEGNTPDETIRFVKEYINLNLTALARISERMASQNVMNQ